MIKINFYQNGYIVSGHANFSSNNDVVCAGVSSIVIGSINWFKPQDIIVKIDDGYLLMKFKSNLEYCINYLELIKIQLESIAVNPNYKKYLKISYFNTLIEGENDAK